MRGLGKVWGRKAVIVLGGLMCLTAAISYHSRVDRRLTEEDHRHISKFLNQTSVQTAKPDSDYERQIRFIREVQRSLFDLTPSNEGIPLGQTRDPKDLFESGHGLCYDRSWVLEKIFKACGFSVRHIYLYRVEGRWPPALRLLMPHIGSHAVTEVKTNRGWLVVDSLQPWVSANSRENPVSIHDMDLRRGEIRWGKAGRDVPDFFRHDFGYVYGLYSRHGMFFPPFNRVPEIHWGDFWSNF